MYLDFFKLKEFPFSLGSDERFFFNSDTHAEALANMLYAVRQRKGMVLITGEVGAGKTFVSNVLATRMGFSAAVSVVRHPPGSAKQLIRSVAGGLGVPLSADTDKLTDIEQLTNRLTQLHRRGRLVAVILDEVQDLPDEAMEEVRLMWNWEQGGQRLLQIVLVGQSELRQRLAERRWASLRQRIVLAYHIGRLDREDTERYIRHRLTVAAGGGECPLTFSPPALDAVHQVSRGIPRLINVLCDNALLTAYTREVYCITPEIVQTVVRNMTSLGFQPDAEEQEPADAEPAETPPPAPDAEPPAAADAPPPAADDAWSASPDARILAAALEGRPALDVARETYRVAEHGSDAHHLAIRVIVQELIATLRSRSIPHGRADTQSGDPAGGGGHPPPGRGDGQGGLGGDRGRADPPEAG